MARQTTWSFARHFTAVGTNADEYLEAGGGLSTSGGWVNVGGAAQISLITRRYSDVGTCTMQVFAEFLYEPENTFYPLFDFAGTAVQGVLQADGATDSAASYQALTIMRELPPGATAGALAYNTIHKAYQCRIPSRIRFRVRSGGTSVQNEYSAMISLHVPSA